MDSGTMASGSGDGGSSGSMATDMGSSSSSRPARQDRN
jgi:hypothetical protein